MQAQIAESAYRYQRDVERKERLIVGVNAFEDEAQEPAAGERFRVDPAIEAEQRRRLAEWRRHRDNERVGALITQLEQTARSSENILPCLIACVESGVTVGEIGKALRRVFGEYHPPTVI